MVTVRLHTFSVLSMLCLGGLGAYPTGIFFNWLFEIEFCNNCD